MIVTWDQKTLLVNSRLNTTLYAYSLPDLKLIGGAALGGKDAEWVANSHTNNVSVVDVASMKEVAVVPVGFAPARNVAWVAP
jgi:YVTN family beta-propeller protein